MRSKARVQNSQGKTARTDRLAEMHNTVRASILVILGRFEVEAD